MNSEEQGIQQPCLPLEYLDLDAHLPYRLGMLTNLVYQATTSAYIRCSGLSGREWRLLGMIGLKGPLQPASAADLTGMDRATVTRAIDQLARLGYLMRKNDAKDGRKIELQLTQAGANKCDEIIPLMRSHGALFDRALSETELQQLYVIFSKLQTQALTLIQQEGQLN